MFYDAIFLVVWVKVYSRARRARDVCTYGRYVFAGFVITCMSPGGNSRQLWVHWLWFQSSWAVMSGFHHSCGNGDLESEFRDGCFDGGIQ